MSIVFLKFFQKNLNSFNLSKLNLIDIFVEFFDERRVRFVGNESRRRNIADAANLLQPYAGNDISAVAVAHMEAVTVQGSTAVENVEFRNILFDLVNDLAGGDDIDAELGSDLLRGLLDRGVHGVEASSVVDETVVSAFFFIRPGAVQ